MDVLPLLSIFPKNSRVKLSFERNGDRKNLILSACRCWGDRLFLREMHQKFEFGGIISYGDSNSDLSFVTPVLRLHPILHDASGAVRSHSDKGPDYCYMIGRGPNSCVLGHVTGLPSCLYAQKSLYLPFSTLSTFEVVSIALY